MSTLLLLPASGRFQAEVQGRDESERRGWVRRAKRELLWHPVWTLKQSPVPTPAVSALLRDSWSFRVTLGWETCSGRKFWKLWNVSENQSPLRRSPSLGHHVLCPCLLKTVPTLMRRTWAGHCFVASSREFPLECTSLYADYIAERPLLAVAHGAMGQQSIWGSYRAAQVGNPLAS